MFVAFFGVKAHRSGQVFISGPLELVKFDEVKKFLIAGALEPFNGRYPYIHVGFANPKPNLRGDLGSDLDEVYALNLFHYRQFIFAEFTKMALNGRVMNYFNRLNYIDLYLQLSHNRRQEHKDAIHVMQKKA